MLRPFLSLHVNPEVLALMVQTTLYDFFSW
jgi:hypothetical protein